MLKMGKILYPIITKFPRGKSITLILNGADCIYRLSRETSHAVARAAFTVISTGTISVLNLPSINIDLTRPAPTAAIAPVGPHILSIQPGMGSVYDPITVDETNKII